MAIMASLSTGTKDEGGPLPTDFPPPDTAGMAEAMTPLLEAIWDEAGSKFNAKIGLDPDAWTVVNPNTQEAIRTASLQFCESTNATTSLELADALAATRGALEAGLIQHGESLAELTRRINDIFQGAETWRARMIAASEASRAVHSAQEMAASDSGVVTGWKWLLSADACPLCQTVARRVPAVRLGQPFAIVGNNPVYSTIRHPPLHPGCQCALEEVLDIDHQPVWHPTLVDPKPEEQDINPEEKGLSRGLAKKRLQPRPQGRRVGGVHRILRDFRKRRPIIGSD